MMIDYCCIPNKSKHIRKTPNTNFKNFTYIMNVLFPRDVDISEIEFSDVRPYGDKAKIVYVNHNKSPIVIQTPIMKTPYGISGFEADNGNVKYSLDLSFGSTNPRVGELREFLDTLDDKILDTSVWKSLDWFKKKNQSRDVSDALFTRSVKLATENGEITDKYPPTFKMKVANYDGKFKPIVFNCQREQLDNDLDSLVSKGQRLTAIVKLNGIWLAGGKFGLVWDLQQIKLEKREDITEYAFNDDDDELLADDTINKPDNDNDYILDSDEDL